MPLLTPPEITSAFNTCTPADLNTASYVTGLVYGWAGGAAEDAYPGTSADTPVRWACNVMSGTASGVAAFQALINVPGQCLNITGAGGQRLYSRPRRFKTEAAFATSSARIGPTASALPLDTNVCAI